MLEFTVRIVGRWRFFEVGIAFPRLSINEAFPSLEKEEVPSVSQTGHLHCKFNPTAHVHAMRKRPMNFARLLWMAFFVCPLAFAQSVAPTSASTPPAPRYTKPAEIPIADFFRRAEYSQMSISPDGNRLAALRPIFGRDNLVVIDFQSGKSSVVTGLKDSDVIDFEWVSNDRLYFRMADNREVSGYRYLKGAYAVDADGKNSRNLMYPLDSARDRESRRNSIQVSQINISFRILSRTFDGSGDVIAEIFGRSQSHADVYRFNTKTGEHKLLTVKTPGNVVRWLLDRDLLPRIAVRQEERTDPAKPRERTIWHRK